MIPETPYEFAERFASQCNPRLDAKEIQALARLVLLRDQRTELRVKWRVASLVKDSRELAGECGGASALSRVAHFIGGLE